MTARAIGSATISFGLVSIPVKLYTATSSQAVRFNQLHAECGNRVKQQLYCPVCDKTVDRAELVKGYEYAKNQYVQMTEDELRKLETEKTHGLDIVEFVPLDSVDLVQIEKSYYLGPDKGGEKAYKLLADAMNRAGKIAVGRYWTRGKQQLVLVRPYRDGLLLHYVYYADEVRSFDDIDRGGDVRYREGELELAEQLIGQLANDHFEADKYRDEWRDRVMNAIEQKVAGEEITEAREQPAAQVIDLFEALKESLGTNPKKAEPAKESEGDEEQAAAKSSSGSKKSAGSGKGRTRGGKSELKPPRKTEPQSGQTKSGSKGASGRSRKKKSS